MRITTSIALFALATIAAGTVQASSVHIKVSSGIVNDADAGITVASKDSPVVVAASANKIENESAEIDSSDSDSDDEEAAGAATGLSASKYLRQAKTHTKSLDQSCSVLANGPWSSIQYVCSWKKSGNYNIFFKRKDGSFVYECQCRKDIDDTYGAFGSHWHHSTDGDVDCYARDSKNAPDLRSVFKSVQCKGSYAKTCDTRANTCSYYEPKADPNSNE